MCGIVGAFSYGIGSEPVPQEALLRARDAMSPRGPDGAGEWFSPDRRVALGHRRLAIIDLSPAGAQPMRLEDDGLCMTFNGEIYNYQELQRHVESKGRVLRSNSDTEVLLHLYALYGESMCERLRGMFAFAIWDEKKRGMLLGRDQFGIKPLYVGRGPGQVVFASQVKAVLASRLIDVSPDPAGHVGFFLWGNVPEPHTLYREIQELPAGSTMWIDGDGIREPKSYFDLSRELSSLERTGSSLSQAEAKDRIRQVVLDSVKHHFVADVPVGVFLSAGRDSTTLLAVATEVCDVPPSSITLGFQEYEGTPDDEVPIAVRVAKQYGSRHLLKRVMGSDFQDDLSQIFSSMDQPTVDGLNTYFVSKVAREFGMKVALSGLGADEFLGGYPSFEQVPALVKWSKAPGKIPGLGKALRIVSSRMIRKKSSPKYAGLLEYGGTYGGAYLLRRGLFSPWELPSLLDPDMVREGWANLQTVATLDRTVNGLSSPRSKVSALESQVYMRNRLLRDSDWAGMAHSIEIRVPFVDVEFVRAVATLYGTQYEPTKRDLAQVPCHPLPQEVIDRPKTGFMVPVRDWLLKSKPERTPEHSLRGWARMVHNEFTNK